MKKILAPLVLLFLFSLQNPSLAQLQYALNLRIEYPTVGFSDGKIVPELVGNYPNPVEYHITTNEGTFIVSDSLTDLPESVFDFVFFSSIEIYVVDLMSTDTIGWSNATFVAATDEVVVEWNSFAGPESPFVCDGHFHGDVFPGLSDSSFVSWAASYDEYELNAVSLPNIPDLNMTNVCSGYYRLDFTLATVVVITFVYVEPLTASSSDIDVEVFTTPSATDVCTGTASATVTGGVSPYQYYWELIPGTDQMNFLCPGLHSLKVIDAVGDSTMVFYGVADSASFYDYYDTLLTIDDTIYFMTEDCGINYSLPIDSIEITFVDFFNDSTVAMGFTITQGANTFYVQDTASYGPPTYGLFLIDLTQFCLSKALGGQLFKFRTTANYFLSADESSKEEITMFPNPADNILYIAGGEISQVMITDLNGKVVLLSEDNLINTTSLPKGIYMVTVIDQNHNTSHVQKLVVIH